MSAILFQFSKKFDFLTSFLFALKTKRLCSLLLFSFFLILTPLQLRAQAPTPQTLCGGAVIGNLVTNNTSGASYQWYDAASGGNSLSITTPLVDGQTYYVTETIDGVATAALGVLVYINTVTGGTIAADQQSCLYGNPDPFTETDASTGSGTPSYQWFLSVTDTSPGSFGEILDATASTYDPDVLFLASIYYKRVTSYTLNDVVCSSESNILHITVDNVDPIWTTQVQDISLECEDIPTIVPPTASDNQGNPIISYTDVSTQTGNGSCSDNSYSIVRTWHVEDACGNEATDQVQNITTGDTKAPVITGSITSTTVEGCNISTAPVPQTTVAGLEALTGDLLITDGCSADTEITIAHTDIVSSTCPIVITRTYTATDVCGNTSADFVHTITISDTQAPAVTGSITATTVEGCDYPAVTTVAALEALTGDLVITDCNADADLIVTNVDATTGNCPTYLTRTYTVTDPCNNASVDIVHNVTMNDTQAPVVAGTLTDSNVEACENSVAETTVAGLEALAGNLTITDACSADADITVAHSDVSSGTCPIVVTRTYTVTDECSNTSAGFVHTINVDDTQAPAITGSITPTTIEACSISALPVAVTTVAELEALPGNLFITDACSADADITVAHSDAITGTCPIIITRTYTVTDVCLNVSVGIVHTIYIDDSLPPVVTGSITPTTVESCSISDAPSAVTTVAALEALPGDLAIADACSADGNLTVTHIDVSSGTCPIVITRTYTVTDECNNSVNIVHTININDTSGPTFTGSITPTNTTNCDVAPEITVAGLEALPGDLEIDDCNVDANLSVTYVDVRVGTCTITLTRTYTVTDPCGNSIDIVHIININDSQAPVISGSITETTVEGCSVAAAPTAQTTVAGIEALTGNLLITDACSADADITVNSNDVALGTCPIVITRTYTVTDPCSNTSVGFVHTINIADTQAPVITGSISNTTVEGCAASDAPTAAITVAELEALTGNLQVADVCSTDSDITVNHSDASTGTCPIVVTRTYTVTDACGNTSVGFVHTINVNDTQAPVIAGSITTTTVEGCNVSDAPAAQITVAGLESLLGDLTITDVCSPDANITVSHTDTSTGTCPIVLTRTYTVTDVCGNTSVDIVQTININDTQAPTFAGSITTTTVEGCNVSDAPAAQTTVAGIEALTGNLTVSDCHADADLIVTYIDASAGTCPIVLTRTYTVTDPCGNASADIVQTINIDDTQAPIITGSITTTTIEGCDISVAPAAEITVAGLIALTGNLTVTDCHANTNLNVTHTDAQSGTCPIVFTRTYTVTDPCGNASVDIVQTINIADTQAPTIAGSITPTIIEGCSLSSLPAAETTVAGIEALPGNLTITDACSADANISVSSVDLTTSTCPISIVRTYTVTDVCGNASLEFVHSITIDDTQAPVITGAITSSVIEGCNVSAAPAETSVARLLALAGNLTITDCYANTSLIVSHSDVVVGTCPIIITRTYTVTDPCGNASVTFIHNIQVTDSQGPAVLGSITTTTVEGCDVSVAPAVTTVAELKALAGNLTITDCYADTDLVVTYNDTQAGTCPIVITRTYTVTDPCGNTSVGIVQTINVDDTQAPVITGSLNETTVEGCDVSYAPAPVTSVAGLKALAGNLTINDCHADADLIVTYNDVPIGTCPIVITRTYTVTDPCSNASIGIIHTIYIDDTQAPVIVGSITTTTVEGCSVNDAPAETTVASLEALPGNLTITDACIADADITVSYTDVLTGTCPIVLTRTYTVKDVCGNANASIVQTINIEDTQAPIVTGSLTASIIEGCSVSDAPAETTVTALEALAGNLTITDCHADADLIVTNVDIAVGTCPIIITRTYTVTDPCNNKSTSFIHVLSVNDTQAPVIAGSITTSTVEGCDVSAASAAETTVAGLEALAGNLTITDCQADADLIVSSNDVSASSCPIVITRTYSVSDPCNNTSVNFIHTINIEDTQAPVISGSITSITVEGCDVSVAPNAETTVAGLESLLGNLIITDVCSADADITVSYIDVSSGTCSIVITRTYTVTDECGNNSNIVHIINVDDTQAPVIAGSITTTTIEGCDVSATLAETTVAGLEALAGNLTITDACSVDQDITVTYVDAPSGTCPIVLTRTYKVTDVCGNTSIDIVQIINIDDTQAPVVAGSITETTIEGCDASYAPAPETTVAGIEALAGNLTITDCHADTDLSVTSNDIAIGNCPIVITRTYTVTDPCNNSSTVIQTINIVDTQAPVIAGSIYSTTVEGCTPSDVPMAVTTVTELEALSGDLTITDACSIDADISVDFVDVPVGSCPITVTRTYTLTDVCGNSSIVNHIILIEDTIVPTASNPAPLRVQCFTTPDITVVIDEADNCTAIPTVTWVNDESDGLSCPETIIRTYQISDDCNNSILVTQNIFIKDTIAPTAGNPADINVQCIGDVPPFDIAEVIDEADNCTTNPVVAFISEESDNGICPEIITRVYSVTDDCANSIFVSQTIIVKDTTRPTASNPLPFFVECIEDIPRPDISIILNVADNCTANPVVEFVSETDDGLPLIRTITRIYSVTDVCGNITYLTQLIHINGIPHPRDDYYTIDENSSNNIFDVLINDDFGCDGSGEFLMEIISLPMYGTVFLNTNGTLLNPTDDYFVYTPYRNNYTDDTFDYSITDKSGDAAIATVHIHFIPNPLHIPEGFSPNGDGINETFHIRGLFYYPNYSIVIFDKEGDTVFEAGPDLNEWDGRNIFTGNELPQDTYFYVLDLGNGTPRIKGFIYLIRKFE